MMVPILARSLLAFFLLAAMPAQAQSYPVKPIRLIVPHAPGGNSDTFGRILAAKLSERVGHSCAMAFVARKTARSMNRTIRKPSYLG